VLKPEEARLRAAITDACRDLTPRRDLAALLLASGRTEEAVAVLAEALRIDHHDLATLIAFSHAQRKWGNTAEAEQACLLALEQDPEHPEALAALAQVLIESERVPEAIAILERSLARRPDNLECRRLYGVALETVGRLDEARRELVEVVTRDPTAAKAYVSLSELETFNRDHDLLHRMQAALARASRPDDPSLAPLYHALGKANDDIGDYDRAFAFFDTGARLQRSQLEYDEDATFATLDAVMATFTPALLARRVEVPASTTMRPVFIVGMPRSGSTLLAQILARHPHVHCVGEAKTFAEKLAMIRRHSPELPLFPAFMPLLDAEALARVSSDYRDHMRERGGAARCFVNKQLGNFIFMGAIHMAMPDARFIVAKRNALDACVSAFATYFESQVPYSYDLAELGRFYRKYEQVIAHWSQVLPPGVMRTIEYEEVVRDLEGQTRGLLEFLGLPWEPACLTFHRSSHPAATASVAQVRRPLYQNSVGRWRHYERHLKPLIEALGPSANAG
jgi:tetratricopeptide (TPR) repeat protein